MTVTNRTTAMTRSRPVSFSGTQLGPLIVSLCLFNRQELLMTSLRSKFRRAWSVSLSGFGLFGVSCELAFKGLDVPAVDTESGDDSLWGTPRMKRHIPKLRSPRGEEHSWAEL